MRFSDFYPVFEFIAPDSTLMTLNTKRLMYSTYSVKSKFRWYWEWFLFIFVFSVSSKLTLCYSDVWNITMIFDWDR